MSIQKKKQDYDAGQIMAEFLNAITEAFGLPYDDRKQEGGCPEQMHLSRASVHNYLSYQKAVYKLDELGTNAECTRLYRERQQAVRALEQLKEQVQSEDGGQFSNSQQELLDEALWHTLVLFQKYPFHTAKKLEFTYTIKGHEIFVDRKEKSITKSTVLIAFHKALELGADATGPKKLGTFGASYLYPVFVRFGIIEAG